MDMKIEVKVNGERVEPALINDSTRYVKVYGPLFQVGRNATMGKRLAAFLPESRRKKPGPPCKTKSDPRVSS